MSHYYSDSLVFIDVWCVCTDFRIIHPSLIIYFWPHTIIRRPSSVCIDHSAVNGSYLWLFCGSPLNAPVSLRVLPILSSGPFEAHHTRHKHWCSGNKKQTCAHEPQYWLKRLVKNDGVKPPFWLVLCSRVTFFLFNAVKLLWHYLYC